MAQDSKEIIKFGVIRRDIRELEQTPSPSLGKVSRTEIETAYHAITKDILQKKGELTETIPTHDDSHDKEDVAINLTMPYINASDQLSQNLKIDTNQAFQAFRIKIEEEPELELGRPTKVRPFLSNPWKVAGVLQLQKPSPHRSPMLLILKLLKVFLPLLRPRTPLKIFLAAINTLLH